MGIALRHIFGLRTSASIFVSSLSGYHFLADKRLLMDDQSSALTVLAFLLAGLISWAIIAYDSYSADKRHADVLGKLDAVSSQLLAHSKAAPPATAPLSDISNGQLRDLAIKVISRLREFASLDEQMASRVWNDTRGKDLGGKELAAHLSRMNAQFNGEFRPDALAVREEMLRRIDPRNIPTLPVDVALDHGMLAGHHPVTDAANNLESILRRLPND